MIAAPAPLRQLHHLTVLSDLYAETPGGGVYAIRQDLRHNWTLVSKSDGFDPRSCPSAEDADAWLTDWLANRG